MLEVLEWSNMMFVLPGAMPWLGRQHSEVFVHLLPEESVVGPAVRIHAG